MIGLELRDAIGKYQKAACALLPPLPACLCAVIGLGLRNTVSKYQRAACALLPPSVLLGSLPATALGLRLSGACRRRLRNVP